MRGRATTIAALCLLVAMPVPRGLSAQTVQGTVVDAETDSPVEAVLVQLISDESGEVLSSETTSAEGRFSLVRPGPGIFRLRLAHIGYQGTTTAPFELLDTDGEVSIRVVLVPQVIALGDVLVEQEPQRGIALRGLALEAFRMRERMGLGVFYTRERLEIWKDTPFHMVLRSFPDVSFYGRSLRKVEVRRGMFTCPVRWFLDGVRVHPLKDPDAPPGNAGMVHAYENEMPLEIELLEATDIEAVEFYRSELEAPHEFGASPNDPTCAVVVVWTRRG